MAHLDNKRVEDNELLVLLAWFGVTGWQVPGFLRTDETPVADAGDDIRRVIVVFVAPVAVERTGARERKHASEDDDSACATY